jgi:hypothetical protein
MVRESGDRQLLCRESSRLIEDRNKAAIKVR